MSLRAQALLEFGLPAAPQRMDRLAPPLPGGEAHRVLALSGRFLLLVSTSPLALAFEATLFDLLAEARYPAPRPRRAKAGGLIARLEPEVGSAAAACYALPSGEAVPPAAATIPQLLEVGRLLARLHQLGETHPAAVPDAGDGVSVLRRVRACDERDLLLDVLRDSLPPLPSGAVHGGLGPNHVLFIGDRASAILPSGRAGSASMLLDLAEAAAAWATNSGQPLAALRAVFSGYQALRRLHREELAAVPAALRHAAAREGARRLAAEAADPLGPLWAMRDIEEAELSAAAGA